MTTRLLPLLLCLLPVLGLRGQSSARSADNGDGTFTNPLLWADWPDPDVIRVGSDFYMVSTSMHYVPGCPILRSKDLVNWEMAGYAVSRYDDDPRYDMQGGTLYLNGAWASSIRHRDGKFYVAFCTPYGWGTDRGHFSLCEADDPAGPWTRTVFPEYMYDPGLFFDDDGRAYVVHGQGTLYVSELAADLKSVKGEPAVIWDTRFGADRKPGGGFGLEGAHVYKRNGMYYILCPAGGTEGWQVCLRSRSIYGPYEYKVVLDDDSSYPPNGLHQGGMVQLENGDWWAIIRQEGGKRSLVMCDNGRVAEVAVDSLPAARVWLRARVTDRGFTARFYYSLDGRTFRPAGTEMKMGLGLPWTANRFALFNFTTAVAGTGGRADFNWFRFRQR